MCNFSFYGILSLYIHFNWKCLHFFLRFHSSSFPSFLRIEKFSHFFLFCLLSSHRKCVDVNRSSMSFMVVVNSFATVWCVQLTNDFFKHVESRKKNLLSYRVAEYQLSLFTRQSPVVCFFSILIFNFWLERKGSLILKATKTWMKYCDGHSSNISCGKNDVGLEMFVCRNTTIGNLK